MKKRKREAPQENHFNTFQAARKHTPKTHTLLHSRLKHWPAICLEWHKKGSDEFSLLSGHYVNFKTTSRWRAHLKKEPNLYVHDVALPHHRANNTATIPLRKRQKLNKNLQERFSMKSVVEFGSDFQVHMASMNPADTRIIALQGNHPKLGIYKKLKPKKQGKPVELEVDKILLGLKGYGWSVDWNPMDPNFLLGADETGLICAWDIKEEGLSTRDGIIPYRRYEQPFSMIEAKWAINGQHFASIDNKGRVVISDRKSPTPLCSFVGRLAEGSSLSWNPRREHLLAVATEGTDGYDGHCCAIWDLRHRAQPLLEPYSKDGILQLKWHPKHYHMLGASCSNGSVQLWNFDNSNEEVSPIFKHAVHQERCLSLDFAPCDDIYVASSDESGLLQIWCPFLETHSHLTDAKKLC